MRVGGDWLTRAETQAVFAALSGQAALAVGGCVRDALLGRPVRDVDIATDAPPERVIAAAGAAGLRALPTGIDHGTVTVVSGGIPHEDEVASLNPDVQQRPGCNYCHAILEPSAAHWGRWTQQGAGFFEPTRFPVYRDECRECALGTTACSDLCRFNYVTRAISPEEEPFLGMLSSLQFLRREHQDNVTAGPRQLVTRGIADGRLTAMPRVT
ncbi:MAG TPA: hypothetical protein PKC84_13255, partial [Paracoccaceae bacterium]|nr:hypothetical protein [Paracoccaceae bacterium]